MISEVKLINLGADVLRLAKTGRLTKINKDGDNWSSDNFKDLGEFNIRLDLLIAESQGDAYYVPAKSASITLTFEDVKKVADFIKPTAGTAVGGPLVLKTADNGLAFLNQLAKAASEVEDKKTVISLKEIEGLYFVLEQEAIRE